MGFFNIEKDKKNNRNTFFNQNPNMMNQGDMYNQGMMDPNMMNYNQGMMPDYNQGMMDQGGMYNQDMMDPNMMNYNQGMMPDYNQGMMPDYNQGMMDQGMMNPQGDMYNQGMMPQQPMMDQGMMNQVPMNQGMPMNNGMGNFGGGVIAPGVNMNSMPDLSGGAVMPEINPNMGNNQSLLVAEPTPNAQNMPVMAPTHGDGELSRYNDPSSVERPVTTDIEPPKGDSQPSLYEETQNALNYYNNKDKQSEEPKEEEIETLEAEVQLPREIEKEMQLSSGTYKTGDNKIEEDKKNDKDDENIQNPSFAKPLLAQMEKYQDIEDIGDQKDVKANVFAAFGIILGMIVKPGTTMLKNAKRFNKMDKAISILLWLAAIFLIACVGVRVLVGSFMRTYSSLSDSYKLVFNPARIFELSNYLEYLLIAASVSIGGVLLVALIYYASSFLNSKGVHFATYLIVSNLGMIPLIVGIVILQPVANIFNSYLGIGALIFSFLSTLITLLIGMNEVLKFKSVNNQIYYHVINLSIVTLIAILVFVFMVHQNWIVLPQMSF